jgi:predicted RNase H-like HicB family nuclease/predicted RNA binding protein YcfA (HicA-like mRNA interferase family)
VKVRDLLKALEAEGWRLKVIKGSHRQLVHPIKRGRVTAASSVERASGRHASQYPKTSGDRSMKEYIVVIEKGVSSYGAYVPDLPGCVAVADTRAEVVRLIRESMDMHLKGMAEDGDPIPEPTSQVEIIGVP